MERYDGNIITGSLGISAFLCMAESDAEMRNAFVDIPLLLL